MPLAEWRQAGRSGSVDEQTTFLLAEYGGDAEKEARRRSRAAWGRADLLSLREALHWHHVCAKVGLARGRLGRNLAIAVILGLASVAWHLLKDDPITGL